MTLNVHVPRVEGEGEKARLKPIQGRVYLVEVASRYGKGDAHRVMVERYGYCEGINKGAFLFLVPVEGGLRRFVHYDEGETIRRYRAPIDRPPVMARVAGREIPTFKVSSRTVIRDLELEHVRRIIDREGLRPRIPIEEVVSVND